MENQSTKYMNKFSVFWKKLTIRMKEAYVTNWIIAFATIVNLLILLYSVIPVGKKEKVVIRGKNELQITLYKCRYLNVYQYLTFRNIGEKTGEIVSIDGLIVSSNTKQGVPTFKQHYTELGYFIGTDYQYFPILNLVLYPNDYWTDRYGFKTKNEEFVDLDNFGAGDYEYLVTFKNDKGKLIKVMHYRFSIDESEMESLKDNCQSHTIYVQLMQLYNIHRIDELLNFLSELKQ